LDVGLFEHTIRMPYLRFADRAAALDMLLRRAAGKEQASHDDLHPDPLTPSWNRLVAATVGFNIADLENLCRQSLIHHKTLSVDALLSTCPQIVPTNLIDVGTPVPSVAFADLFGLDPIIQKIQVYVDADTLSIF
jgi:SpoVK/Ycf46/Vps4 family AAA+-type ATPase